MRPTGAIEQAYKDAAVAKIQRAINNYKLFKDVDLNKINKITIKYVIN